MIPFGEIAVHEYEAAYPHLWNGLLAAGIPALGQYGSRIRNPLPFGRQWSMTGSGYSWDQVKGYPALSVTGATYYPMTLPRATTTAYTVVAWLTMASGSHDPIGGDWYSYVRFLGGSGRLYVYVHNTSGGGFAEGYITPTLGANEFYQCAVVADDTGVNGYLRTYFNGRRFTTVGSKSGTLRSLGTVNIGAGVPTGGNYNYTGKIAGAWIYNRALTDDQVAELYTLGPVNWLSKRLPVVFVGGSGGAQVITMPVAEATASAIAQTVTQSAVTVTVPNVEATASAITQTVTQSAVTVTVPNVEATASAITQTVTQSAVTVTVPNAEATASVVAPTIEGGAQTLTMPVAEATASVVAQTVTQSAVTVTVPNVEATASVITQTVTQSAVVISMPVVEATASVIVPNVEGGAQVLLVTNAEAIASVVVPTVSQSAVTITMPVVEATASAIAPSVESGATLDPGVATANASVVIPTVALSAVTVLLDVITAVASVVVPNVVTVASIDTIGMEYRSLEKRLHYRAANQRLHYRAEEE